MFDWSSGLVSALYPSARDGSVWLRQWAKRMEGLSTPQKHAVRLTPEYLLDTQADWWGTDEAPGNQLKLALPGEPLDDGSTIRTNSGGQHVFEGWRFSRTIDADFVIPGPVTWIRT